MKTANGTESKGAPSFIRRVQQVSVFNIVLILAGMCLLLSIAVGGKFLSATNITSVVRQFSFYAIMATGMLLAIITGGIDLSSGSVFAFSSIITCLFIAKWDIPLLTGMPVLLRVILGVLLGMLSGAAFGYLNGALITLLKLPPFIATLGTMSIARGLSYGITGGYPIGSLPDQFKFIGLGTIGAGSVQIPTPIILMVVLALLFSFFLRKTILGRWVYAIGGNEEAARIAGVRVDRTKRIVYALCGLMSSIAGIATAARLGVGQSTAGQGYEMDAIAAVIIGGASVNGGVGTVLGSVLGAAIMGVLRNGLVLLNVSAYWQQAVLGVVIVVAVSFDKLQHDRKK
ncbi:MAG: ABC transporter permease [Clostridiales bacterium]|jgi:ribose transport system permease protein|nr:ABC transporter permease [Bacillota bacterium]NLL55140.1 ABC transporter permease [Clostridiales bacterium]